MNKSVKYLNRLVIFSSWFFKFINRVLRVLRQLTNFFRKILAGLYGTDISDTKFQRSLLSEFASKAEFLGSFKDQQSRVFFIQPRYKKEIIASLLQICPDANRLIIQAADTICEHYFDLLGSGPVNLGWPIDWHSDFKTGFRWNPRQYYADIRPASFPGGYDLKVPWELSRCQHFVWLGQAYWLTGDEKYTYEFRAEIEDWIRQNPPEFGVNWACSMDIAIRAVNWLWGYAFFQVSSILDDDFITAFFKSLLCHGRHIMANLEKRTTYSGNHYLSDLVALVYLGILIPEFREARSWREFGLNELENEMFQQVYPDGGNAEASTNYHRLVTELFLSTTLLARLNGYNFSEKFMTRLEQMLEYICQITKPDGTVPILGDQDNGRLHRLKVWADPAQEWKDFRSLLAIGSILFERADWGKYAGDQWEEAVWLYGEVALTAYRKYAETLSTGLLSTGFKDSGLYIMRADDIYIAVDLGPIGQNGIGGHAHNDTLSFELFGSGQTWIQDPGTYVYTSDYHSRNLFRSTAFHNILTFPGYEQNSFDTLSLFGLKNESASQVLSWYTEPGSNTHLVGEYRRVKNPKIIHRRSFYLSQEDRALLITDRVGNTKSTCQLMIHFAQGLELELVEEPYAGIKMINSDGKITWLFSVSTEEIEIQLSEGWISESYGRRVPSSVMSVELGSDFNHRMIILLPGSGDISRRIENVIKHEDYHS